MRWKDSNSLSARAVFALLLGSYRVRSFLSGLRRVSGLSWTVLVLAVLSTMFRSWIAFAALGITSVAYLNQWLYFRYYVARAGLEEVDEMTGWEFEKWVRRFLENVGYDVEQTPYQGDFGADLVATWNGVRMAVQAKRSSRLVGIRAVQEVVAAKAYYDCERAMVITNSHYTEQAAILARANGVLLRTRDDLALKLAELPRADRQVTRPLTLSS